jgi:serine protease Do
MAKRMTERDAPPRQALGAWLALGMAVLFGVTAAPSLSAQEPNALDAALTLEKAVVEAIQRAEKSVVAIARVRNDGPALAPGTTLLPPLVPRFSGEASAGHLLPNEFGAGVVIDRQGFILTNYHVLGDPAKNDYYVWANRRPFKVVSVLKAAAVKAGDPWTDLAVLKIDADDLEPIVWGDSKSLKKGQFVIALGNPYGIAEDGQVSASWGIIANLDRKVPAATGRESEAGKDTLYHFGGLIQVDAKLQLGTSGGALVNLKGEMVGLITALGVLDGYEKSLGFAIPVDDVFRRTIETLKTGRKAEFGFLGVAPENLKEAERQRGQQGARVRDVVPGTPAFAAHLQEGDVITRINDQPVYDRDALMGELGRQPIGAEVRLTVQRRGDAGRSARIVETTAKLTKKHVTAARPVFSQIKDPRWRGMVVDYATALPPPVLRQVQQSLAPEGCLAVLDVDRDSPAWKAGLRPGMLMSHVGGQRVTLPEQFFEAVKDQTGEVRLKVISGASGTVTVQP